MPDTQPAGRRRHVVLVGPMGVGKTSVGRLLARELGRPLRDSDDDLASEQGISGRELAERAGVGALHRWEADELVRALDDPAPSVVAAAASVVDDDECRRRLAENVVIWLAAPPSVVARRSSASGQAHRRAVPAGEAALAARRTAAYRAVADIVVDVASATPERAAAQALAALPPGLRRG